MKNFTNKFKLFFLGLVSMGVFCFQNYSFASESKRNSLDSTVEGSKAASEKEDVEGLNDCHSYIDRLGEKEVEGLSNCCKEDFLNSFEYLTFGSLDGDEEIKPFLAHGLKMGEGLKSKASIYVTDGKSLKAKSENLKSLGDEDKFVCLELFVSEEDSKFVDLDSVFVEVKRKNSDGEEIIFEKELPLVKFLDSIFCKVFESECKLVGDKPSEKIKRYYKYLFEHIEKKYPKVLEKTFNVNEFFDLKNGNKSNNGKYELNIYKDSSKAEVISSSELVLSLVL